MPETHVRLKDALRSRHWQVYRTFCREYDKAAKVIDSDLVGTAPSRAQLHRWLKGEIKGLPYPDHCRVLERMLTDWTVEELFEPCGPTCPQEADTSPHAMVGSITRSIATVSPIPRRLASGAEARQLRCPRHAEPLLI